MPRFESKYLVLNEKKDEILNDLKPYLIYDYYTEKEASKEYTVRSIYLDTHVLTSYYEKLAGLKVRNKFRVRGYNNLSEDSVVFTEIKRKENNFISKDRALLQYSELSGFLKKGDLTKVLNHTVEYEARLRSAKNFLFYLNRDKLEPKINIVYEREAFECKFGSGLRVTLDMNIRSSLTNTFDTLFDNVEMGNIFPSHFILEIKHSKVLPSWIPTLVNKHNLKKESLSKYALCVDWYLKNRVLVHNI